VNGQFLPTDLRQSVSTVRIVDRKMIERRAAVNLEELLQTEPNIRLSQDAVLGSALTVNGLRGENVKILVDGVPVVGRLNGSVDAGQLPLGAVQQVEIIEGAQSLLYGSDASAGVINLVTRKTQAKPVEAEANTQWESNGFRNLQGRAGLRVGKFLVQLTGSQLAFDPAPDTAYGRDQLWNPKRQANGRALLRYMPSDRLDLRLSGSLFMETVDNLGDLRRPTFKPYAFDDYYHTRREDVTLHAEGWTRKRLFWQATAAANQFDRVKNTYRFDFEDSKKGLIEGQQDTSAASGLLTRFTLASDRRDRRFNFLLGAENYAESADSKRIVDSTSTAQNRARSNDFGFFGSVKAVFAGKLTLQGGARWTQNRLYGAAVTPSLWALWQPAAGWQLRVSYANGFRSPGLKELYFNFIDINHYLVGNPDLRPERSDNLRGELSWTLQQSNKNALRMTAAGFYNRVRDRIILAEFAPVQYQYENLSRWETVGGSTGLTYSRGTWLRFRTEAVLTGFHNTYAEETDSLPLRSWSPDWVNELTLNAWDGRIGCTIWHKHTGATPYFFEDDGQVRQGKSDSWNMLNAALNVAFLHRKVRANLGVKNILDTQQIRSGASDELGHVADGLRPVHWGRTFFVNVVLSLGN
jgi:outer membrane receptor for ferrienterochelin and colicins